MIRSDRADDPRFAPLLARYLLTLKEHRGELLAARDAGDGEALRQVAHKLRGTGSSYGFPSITAAAEAVEEPLRSGSGLAELAAEVAHLEELLVGAVRSSDPSYS